MSLKLQIQSCLVYLLLKLWRKDVFMSALNCPTSFQHRAFHCHQLHWVVCILSSHSKMSSTKLNPDQLTSLKTSIAITVQTHCLNIGVPCGYAAPLTDLFKSKPMLRLLTHCSISLPDLKLAHFEMYKRKKNDILILCFGFSSSVNARVTTSPHRH